MHTVAILYRLEQMLLHKFTEACPGKGFPHTSNGWNHRSRSVVMFVHFDGRSTCTGHWRIICSVLSMILIVALVVACVFGRPDQPGYGVEHPPANYEFQYAVQDGDSGNDFSHQEDRDGDAIRGTYYVQLPDGRLQKVTYTVSGDSGYVAEISYEGEPSYPPKEKTYA